MSQQPDIDIDYLSRLARIGLSSEEKEAFSGQLVKILEYFEQIRAVDVTGVAPTAHAFPLHNVLRDDVPEAPLTREQALRCAPAHRDGQFVVPKVVEDA